MEPARAICRGCKRDQWKHHASNLLESSHTGIRFRIGGFTIDLLPYREIERPRGTTHPATCDTAMSVWAFEEIKAASLPLPLGDVDRVRIPNAAGFAAAKLGAWLDLSEWLEVKDAADLALILFWHSESPEIQGRLYDTGQGSAIFVAESADVPRAAARPLGLDVANAIGPQRTSELLARWPGDPDRRHELVEAVTSGLRDGREATP